MPTPMEIPVYLFTGFLESGKTSFIQSIMNDPSFFEGERSLLILCEEGEVEYKKMLLEDTNTTMVVVEDQEDFNREFLALCEHKYHPDRVLIEWNGMWKLSELPPNVFPKHWILYQTVTTVDSRTFDNYFVNMGGFMYEMLSTTDMIVFNRAGENTAEQIRNRKIRMINRRADIFMDFTDGHSEVYQEDLSVTLDMNAPIVDITDADYGRWYFDAMENTQKYDRKTVRFLCQVYRPKGMQKHCFAAGRFMMLCCPEDISFSAMIARHACAETLVDRDWYTITEEIRNEFFQEYEGKGPVLYVKSLEPAQKPQDDLIYIK